MTELIKKYQDIVDDLEYAKDQLNGPNAKKETITLYDNSIRTYNQVINDLTELSIEQQVNKTKILNYLSLIHNILW